MVQGFERAEREFEIARDNEGCSCEPKWINADGDYNCDYCDIEDCELRKA